MMKNSSKLLMGLGVLAGIGAIIWGVTRKPKISFSVGISGVPDIFNSSDGKAYWALYYWDPQAKTWTEGATGTTEVSLKVSQVSTGGAVAVKLWDPVAQSWSVVTYSNYFNPVNGGTYVFDFPTKHIA
jgi:hypothetical protein